MTAVLFFNPKPGTSFASGDKLYFYVTGTTDDLTVYQDSALSTPHAQPVVADSSGTFATIYIDATGSIPKVKLESSASVEKWTIDPFPISDLTTLTASVATNTADIATLEGQVTTSEGEIDTLQTESSDYESRLTTLEGSSGTNVSESDFTGSNQSLGTGGYQDLPGGLTFQWGQFTCASNSTVSVSFPKAFSTVYQAVTCFGANNGTDGNYVSAESPTTTGFTARSSGGSITCRYIAIGAT